ncbi:PhnA domain-containing protein [Aliiroseovarius sp. M344]|uniref:PhnA domain-containing protein n=1 Tax=Aliiroseovarius sp. M344 TaxID=2867010 RepID=UPI0021ADA4BC|nr:alkylphosphonate utilization protein [Aliiroseovarius sp. M344]UWQ13787.1 PhnA domain-containing protein [Aliiroseovarius sp. M344]
MTCPLCAADAPLSAFPVPGGPEGAAVDICATCAVQIDGTPEETHWRGLASSMWSEDVAVQVLSVRMLKRIEASWAQDLLDQVYLDEDTQVWVDNVAAASQHKDSNGATLSQGDNVVLIKDLPVKGAGFTAKRGTAVRGISLVADNPEHIEGRVEGQRIVILTQFVKKK